ncbi:MAG: hypothetical protein RML37_03740 [Chitinophagales bacterium]|nr:hypothetical protein [Chitinophagales bacterium]
MLPIIFFLFLGKGISAQADLQITTEVRSFSKGNYSSYQVTIPQASLRDTEREWMRYLRRGSKARPEMINGEIIQRGAVDKNVSPAPFIVYSKLLETGKEVILTAWFTDNDTLFYSAAQSSDRDIAVRKYLRDFAVLAYRNALSAELSREKQKLNALEEALEALIRSEERARRKINEHQRSIERNESAVRLNETEQKNKINQIAQQKRTAESLRSMPEAYKAALKTAEQYESDLKKLQREHEKLHRGADSRRRDIRTLEREIEKSKSEQEVKKAQIASQTATVRSVEEKLNNIR